MTEKKKTGEKQDRKPGTWKPGETGNPKGRPKLGEALSDVFRKKLPPRQVYQRAESLRQKAVKKGDLALAFRIHEWEVERAYGPVPRDVNMDVTAFGPEAQAMLAALVLTPEQRRARAEELRRKAAVDTKPAPVAKESRSRDADE